MLTMALHNPARLGRLIGGRASLLSTISIYAGASVVVAREWDWFSSFVARHLRRAGVPLSFGKVRGAIRRLNARAGRTLITYRHTEAILKAYEALGDRGVSGDDADRLIVAALEYGYRASGKPWKGLNRLSELVIYSGVDPKSPEWPAIFDATMCAPVDYSHVPGREWIVRDYSIGKHLMQIDGKIAPGDRWAGFNRGADRSPPGTFAPARTGPSSAAATPSRSRHFSTAWSWRKVRITSASAKRSFRSSRRRRFSSTPRSSNRRWRRCSIMRRRSRGRTTGGSTCATTSRTTFPSASSAACWIFPRTSWPRSSIGPSRRCGRWTPTQASGSPRHAPANARRTSCVPTSSTNSRSRGWASSRARPQPSRATKPSRSRTRRQLGVVIFAGFETTTGLLEGFEALCATRSSSPIARSLVVACR